MHHVEFAHNMVFKSPWALTKLFHRHLAVNYEHLFAQQIQRFFGHRYKPDHGNKCELRIHHKSQSVTVMRMRSKGCSLKQYNKFQRILRSEITVTNVKDLRIYKALVNLSKLKDRLENVLSSFQETQYAVHQATCTSGQLAVLAKGGNVGRSRVAGIRLDNERIMRIVALLPHLAHLPDGFRIADLRNLVSEVSRKTYSPSQISYDLRKLRAKNLLVSVPGKKRYKLNAKGVTLAAILPPLADKLGNVLVGFSGTLRKCRFPEKFKNPLDQFYYNIENEIFSMLNLFCLKYL
jgi:DNA-binding transcriptional ArsR family regulator